jgi:hypothetical protein
MRLLLEDDPPVNTREVVKRILAASDQLGDPVETIASAR